MSVDAPRFEIAQGRGPGPDQMEILRKAHADRKLVFDLYGVAVSEIAIAFGYPTEEWWICPIVLEEGPGPSMSVHPGRVEARDADQRGPQLCRYGLDPASSEAGVERHVDGSDWSVYRIGLAQGSHR